MTRSILIVDDEIGIRILLEDLLEGEGYTVVTAANGKEALDILHKHHFDLMIIDYKLPNIDGIEVLRQLETDKKEIKAILMSGLIEDINDDIFDLTNVKKVLSKPFDVLKVREYIKKLLTD